MQDPKPPLTKAEGQARIEGVSAERSRPATTIHLKSSRLR